MPQDRDKKESWVTVLGVFSFAVLILLILIWLVGSNKIVWHSLKPMLFLGALWKAIPLDFFYSQWNSLVISAAEFGRDPTNTNFMDWAAFVNRAMLPVVVLICVAYVCALPMLVFRKRRNIFRKFTPDSLLLHTMKTFTGVAPVIAIRKQIAQDRLPQWRRQVTPEEVFLGSVDGKPVVKDGEFDSKVAERYFTGVKGREAGRWISATLGRQLVDLIQDASRSKKICFADRLSSEGKALFALWAAVAFGDEEGKKEYTQYCAALNRSAFGSPTGSANLTVVQPLYDKYRMHRSAQNLFGVHHWEHTLLAALLEIAQGRGRYTTAEVLWLRPMNRVMFFALNSVGAKTPHVEAAATFSQRAFEIECFRKQRLPLVEVQRGGTKALEHAIFVQPAVEGLKAEYEHWKISTDDSADWWAQKDTWSGTDTSLLSAINSLNESASVANEAARAEREAAFAERGNT